ncbi:MAG: hypothetical protein ACI4XM_00155 [Candidatus Coprovivens sp.]
MGQCECRCRSVGELITNGNMESVTNNKPNGWTFTNPNGVTSENSQGRVHSGNWSVNIEDNSSIKQTIPISECGCYYEISFFARGEGSQVGLELNALYETPSGQVQAGTLSIRQQDITDLNRDFGYYRLITYQAPSGVTGLTLEFKVTANGEQSLDLDDVSVIIA